MDVPRRISHDNVELAEDSEVEDPQIAINPLGWHVPVTLADSVDPLLPIEIIAIEDVVDVFALILLWALIEIGAIAQFLLGVVL